MQNEKRRTTEHSNEFGLSKLGRTARTVCSFKRRLCSPQGIRYRGNWGYGLWQQAVASKEDLTADNFQKAYGMMEAFKRDSGEPLGLRATHLVVDSTNRAAEEGILLKQNLVGGESNINYNRVKLITCRWM